MYFGFRYIYTLYTYTRTPQPYFGAVASLCVTRDPLTHKLSAGRWPGILGYTREDSKVQSATRLHASNFGNHTRDVSIHTHTSTLLGGYVNTLGATRRERYTVRSWLRVRIRKCDMQQWHHMSVGRR